MKQVLVSPDIGDRYRAGASLNGLASEEGVCVSTIRLRLLEAGVKLRPCGRRVQPYTPKVHGPIVDGYRGTFKRTKCGVNRSRDIYHVVCAHGGDGARLSEVYKDLGLESSDRGPIAARLVGLAKRGLVANRAGRWVAI